MPFNIVDSLPCFFFLLHIYMPKGLYLEDLKQKDTAVSKSSVKPEAWSANPSFSAPSSPPLGLTTWLTCTMWLQLNPQWLQLNLQWHALVFSQRARLSALESKDLGQSPSFAHFKLGSHRSLALPTSISQPEKWAPETMVFKKWKGNFKLCLWRCSVKAFGFLLRF